MIYPNTEIYLILFQGGTGGNFLASILHEILFPGSVPMEVTKFGSAHNNFTTNYIIKKTYHQHFNNIYDHIDIIDESKPIIIYDHLTPNWTDLFQKFPKSKILVITLDQNDYSRYRGNFFLKVIAENYRPIKNEDPWLAFKQEHSPLLDNIEDPTKIDAELTEILFNKGKDFFTAPTFIDLDIFPEIYKNHVYYIKFYDLMNENDLLLSQISTITERNCPDSAVNTYRNYMKAQRNLAEKYMPWLT